MSNARANAAVYDQRRRKLKKRNKRYFQRIMIALIAFYAICLTSKMWLKNNYKNIDITPIGSVVSQNNREVTLISWSYCRDERKMEVLLGISNTAYDGNDTYEWSAEDKDAGSLKVTPIIEERNFVVLQLTDLPSRITVISLRMDQSKIQDFETIRLYAAPDRNMKSVTDIKVKSKEEYQIQQIQSEIELANETISDLEEEIRKNKSTIRNLNTAIKDAESDLQYQTSSEMESTNQKISTLRSQKKNANEAIDTAKKKIQELNEKIENLNKEIDSISSSGR
ncbi:hypothetical protein [[Ruminococcus] lactaris]|uniref:hypothetical protein n=1 Tax=[Ruminococcus] lactaris TaxID=46228 RepID=UPI001D04C4AF|nr:hypothetical protein [[Ruminococcus] lactaris]MCB5540001.1 hypothetical protein [[Ruminococcus] lactaris]MCB5553905.1 hypothetical protein [[Ruminococcus] lactaris]MCB5738856.1 hypothetical protein [[Ruminococcus] lactaris]MCB5832020.1 hypothetical protein [[Ruminococcus] lactaris]MCB5846987.1 hypothetical protein [[Ruminococcus] lactaris]